MLLNMSIKEARETRQIFGEHTYSVFHSQYLNCKVARYEDAAHRQVYMAIEAHVEHVELFRAPNLLGLLYRVDQEAETIKAMGMLK